MTHKVKVTMTIPEISKVDTCYEIKQNGKKLGELKISKGGIDYFPKGYSVNKVKKSWTQLHELLVKHLLLPVFVLLVVSSCTKTKEDIAKEKIKEFVQSNFNDPTIYENIEYGKLVLCLDTERIERNATYTSDSIQLSIVMEQNDKIDPEYNAHSDELQAELKRLESERVTLNNEYSGKIYFMTDKFRSKNAIGALAVATHTFVFDTLMTIRNCKTE